MDAIDEKAAPTRVSGWVVSAPSGLPPGDRRAAQRLGFVLAVTVAIGCDLVAVTLDGIPGGSGTSGGPPWTDWLFGPTNLVAGIVPLVAAAPFGWLLGPRLARARLPGKIGLALVMAVMTTLLGDVLVVSGWLADGAFRPGAGDPWTVLAAAELALIGAVVVGPVVTVFATLPAAIVWVCAFRIAWRPSRATLTA